MIDYLVKLCCEHPLLTYLEDPTANEDFEGMTKLQECLAEKNLAVQVGLRTCFVLPEKEAIQTKIMETTDFPPKQHKPNIMDSVS